MHQQLSRSLQSWQLGVCCAFLVKAVYAEQTKTKRLLECFTAQSLHR